MFKYIINNYLDTKEKVTCHMQTGTFTELGAPIESLNSELEHRANLYNFPNYLQTQKHDINHNSKLHAYQPIKTYSLDNGHTHKPHITLERLPIPPTPEKLDMFEPVQPYASVSHARRIIQPPIDCYKPKQSDYNYEDCDDNYDDEFMDYKRTCRYPHNINTFGLTSDPSVTYIRSKFKKSQMRIRAKYKQLRKEIKNMYRLISIMMQSKSYINNNQNTNMNKNNTGLWCMVVGLTVAVIFMFIIILLCWKRLPG